MDQTAQEQDSVSVGQLGMCLLSKLCLPTQNARLCNAASALPEHRCTSQQPALLRPGHVPEEDCSKADQFRPDGVGFTKVWDVMPTI